MEKHEYITGETPVTEGADRKWAEIKIEQLVQRIQKGERNMKNRKFKIAVVSGLLVFVLLCICILMHASDAAVQTIAALFGSIILFYMGGNVGEHFAVTRHTDK